MKILMLAFLDVQPLDVAGSLDAFAEAGRQVGIARRTVYSS